jgi:ABC-type transporter Mla maintaining outer membrane lipid asymmetry ATPase subunit MlaF
MRQRAALARALAADARAAGIVEFRATVAGDNPQAVSILARCTRGLRTRWLGGERELVAALD